MANTTKSQYKPAKFIFTPQESLSIQNMADLAARGIVTRPDAKYVVDPKTGVRYPTHRVLKHGGQTNHAI